MTCAHCHADLLWRHFRFCDDACRQAAYRRRRAGLPEDHLAGGGRRGRVPLAAMTKTEFTAALDEIRARVDRTTSVVERRTAIREAHGLLEANRHLLDAVERLARIDAAAAEDRAERDA